MKKYLALLVAFVLVIGMLAGCGNSAASSAAASAAQSEASSAAVEEPAAEEAAEPAAEETSATDTAIAAESAEEEPVLGPDAYYACEDTTEITVLFQYAAWFQSFFPEGWGQSEFWTALGEATNTTYTLEEVANMAWTERLNLLCASGDLPDVVTNMGSVYNGGLSAAIRDEQIIDIAPMIEENAPHYYEAVTQDEYTLKCCLDDDNEMGGMYALMDDYADLADGLWIRQDWLDEVGMDIPTDTDSFYDVLCAFRDQLGATQGLFQMIRTNSSTIGLELEGVWNAFGPVNYYLDDNNEIQVSFMQDYYYDYLAYLQKLANDGLLITSELTDEDANYFFTNDLIGIEGESTNNVPDYIALMSEEDQAKVDLVAMPALGEPSEYHEKLSLVATSNGGGGTISISTNCENPEVVLKAFDYLFTEPGAVLSVYGEEGVSYELVDGEPQLTDLIVNNPDGIPLNAALGYWCNPGLPGASDPTRTYFSYDENQLEAADIWEEAYTGDEATVDIDSLTLTEEEQDEISVYTSDLKTYVEEWTNGVIFNGGDLSDASIKEFQDYLVDTLHMDDILEVYNAAYDRFNDRSL